MSVAEIDLTVSALLSRLAPASVSPLTSLEYWNLSRSVPLAELAGKSAEELSANLGIKPDVAARIPVLLERSMALAIATEEFEHRGFWVITGNDLHYPQRLRDRLGDQAPAILYGVGDRRLLNVDGIGVVGSRDIGPDQVAVAKSVARTAASQQVPIVSGGARGVDQQAMSAAFEYGGTVVGALADSLLRRANDASIRHAVAEERLCLVTPYNPRAPFSAGNAMGRNKIIYGLSSAVVVVRSDKDSGGTWAGATEALKKNFTTVYSWIGAGAGPGNRPLVDLGAHTLNEADDLAERLFEPRGVERVAPIKQSVPATLF